MTVKYEVSVEVPSGDVPPEEHRIAAALRQEFQNDDGTGCARWSVKKIQNTAS